MKGEWPLQQYNDPNQASIGSSWKFWNGLQSSQQNINQNNTELEAFETRIKENPINKKWKTPHNYKKYLQARIFARGGFTKYWPWRVMDYM